MGSRDFCVNRDMVFAVMKHTGKTETYVPLRVEAGHNGMADLISFR